MEDLGHPTSILLVVAVLFTAGLILFIGYVAFTNINDALLDAPLINQNEDAVTAIESVRSTGQLIDYVYLFFILAFLIALPIGAYFAPTHPAIYVVFIFIFFLALTLSVIFSDAFEIIGEEEIAEEHYNNMPILKNFMYYLPLIIIINAVVTGVILFGKARAGAGEY